MLFGVPGLGWPMGNGSMEHSSVLWQHIEIIPRVIPPIRVLNATKSRIGLSIERNAREASQTPRPLPPAKIRNHKTLNLEPRNLEPA